LVTGFAGGEERAHHHQEQPDEVSDELRDRGVHELGEPEQARNDNGEAEERNP
jgi:hypothetical protein